MSHGDGRVTACWLVCETRRRHAHTWYVPNPTMGKAIREALEKRGAQATVPVNCRPDNCSEAPIGENVAKVPTKGMQYRNVDSDQLSGLALDELCREIHKPWTRKERGSARPINLRHVLLPEFDPGWLQSVDPSSRESPRDHGGRVRGDRPAGPRSVSRLPAVDESTLQANDFASHAFAVWRNPGSTPPCAT